MDDYITALDAAAIIGMSPARFALFLMNNRNILPTELNQDALSGNPGAIFAPRALEKFYAGNPTAIGLIYLKIHRLDWDSYVASLDTKQEDEGEHVTQEESPNTGNQHKLLIGKKEITEYTNCSWTTIRKKVGLPLGRTLANKPTLDIEEYLEWMKNKPPGK